MKLNPHQTWPYLHQKSRHLQWPVLNPAHPLVGHPDHHGVSVVFAYLCHRTLRINAVGSEDVLPHTQDFKNFALIQMFCNLPYAIGEGGGIRNDAPDNSTRSFTKSGYRQFVLDWYRYLGKGKRKLCPSCVLKVIRGHYPSQAGVSMGFRH